MIECQNRLDVFGEKLIDQAIVEAYPGFVDLALSRRINAGPAYGEP